MTASDPRANLITSPRNPRIKYLRSLLKRKYRQRAGCFLVEGIRTVEEALTLGARVETLVYAPELLVSSRASGLVEQVGRDRRWALSADLFRTLSSRDDPQGMAAVVRIVPGSLDDLPPADDMLVLVAYQLRDPGNLGAIIRTADAVGATGVVVVSPSVDPYDPRSVRATMGSLFAVPALPIIEECQLAPWITQVRATGLPLLVVGTSARAAMTHFDVDYRRPTLLLIGSERSGLPSAVCDSADLCVRLPMAGRATSLNASAAAAALVYEIIRQRTTNPM